METKLIEFCWENTITLSSSNICNQIIEYYFNTPLIHDIGRIWTRNEQFFITTDSGLYVSNHDVEWGGHREDIFPKWSYHLP